MALAATVRDTSSGANKLGGHPARAAGPAAWSDMLRANCALGFARDMAVLHDSASLSCDGCGKARDVGALMGLHSPASACQDRPIEPALGTG